MNTDLTPGAPLRLTNSIYSNPDEEIGLKAAAGEIVTYIESLNAGAMWVAHRNHPRMLIRNTQVKRADRG